MTSPSGHGATTGQLRLLDACVSIQLLPVHSAWSSTMSTSVHFQGPALQKPAGLVSTRVLLRSGHSDKYHAQGLSWFFIPARHHSLVFLLEEQKLVWSGQGPQEMVRAVFVSWEGVWSARYPSTLPECLP